MKILSALLLMTFSCIVTAESYFTFQSVETRYYTISPRSPEEIKPEVMRKSPIRSGEKAVDKHTEWYIDWNYRTETGAYGCQVSEVETKARTRHALPRLNRYVADEKTTAAFNQFFTELKQNQKRYGKNGILAAKELDQAIWGIPPQGDCRQLSKIIDDTAKKIIEKYSLKK